MTAEASPELQLTYRTEPDGSTRVDLMEGDRSLSWLWIVPLTIRIGKAVVRMDGIGGVNTREEYRRRGYSRRVLEAAVERMRQGDAALSMLYGISDFYPKFGYATAGPDHFVRLIGLTELPPVPGGWRVRPFAPADLTAVQSLYDQGTAGAVGSAVRPPEARLWRRLVQPKDDGEVGCRVIEDPAGRLRAYAWRARWHWSVGFLERDHPDALVIAEAVADGPQSADVVLAACREWAADETTRRPEPVRQVMLSLSPDGPVAAAARHQSAHFEIRYSRCGSSMARLLDVGRLLEALKPELSQRLADAGMPFHGCARFQTELGSARLDVDAEGVLRVSPDPEESSLPVHNRPAAMERPAQPLDIRLPQTTLARLALGAFPPDDLLSRLEQPPSEPAQRLIRTLFPLRHPHMYQPDRY